MAPRITNYKLPRNYLLSRLVRNARAYTSARARSTGFYVIWVSISSCISSTGQGPGPERQSPHLDSYRMLNV